MSVVRSRDLAMRRLGDTWFVKHVRHRFFVELSGPLATLWDALLDAATESAALAQFLIHYGGSPEARADAPGLLAALRSIGLLDSADPAHTPQVRRGHPANTCVASSSEDVQDAMYRTALDLKRPLLAEYEMTYRCNLRCAYCYQPEYLKTGEHADLTAGAISHMLADFAQAGVFFLIVTGGECTLNPLFEHVVHEARAHHMDVSVLTNGTILSPRVLSVLTEAPVSEVKVSIYGENPEEYRRFTRSAAAFGRVERNLVRLREAGVNVVAKVIVTSVQAAGFRRTLRRLEELGIPTELSAHVMPAMDGDRYPLQYRVDSATLRTLFRDHVGLVTRRECTAGTVKFRVAPDGSVNVCELHRDSIGNVTKATILEILGGERGRQTVDTLTRAGGRARADPEVRGLPCPALGKLEHGSWDTQSAEAKRWTQVAIEARRS
jgi:MoaA/NifB/PqqE/SkfB family radical SAM enzyme